MDLDNVTIEIRPRKAWEAVDLGVLMARRWWWQLVQIWFLISFPLWILLSFLPLEYVIWQMVIIVWLKPIFERALLYFLSHAVFGSIPTVAESVKRFPSLIGFQIFSTLTIRRLSPSRSMDMSVSQLEGLRGNRRTDRLNVLHREDSTPATWLTFSMWFIEIFLWVSFFTIVALFIPQGIEVDIDDYLYSDATKPMMLVYSIVLYCVWMCTAPFYVACGFSLYLNRRVRLEAWDIEIAFRRMAQKRQGVNTLAIAVLCFALTFSYDSWQNTAQADPLANHDVTLENSELTPETAAKLINDIHDGDKFNVKKERTRARLKNVPEWEWNSNKEERENSDSVGNGLMAFFSALAVFGEVIIWVVVIGIIVFVVVRYREWFMQFVGFERTIERELAPPPKTLFGLNITEESLPEDIGQTALAILKAGNTREAMALLYRASLNKLVIFGVHLHSSFTEIQCLNSAKESLAKHLVSDDQVDYLSDFTDAWRRHAYGHERVSAQRVEEFCQHWNRVWFREDAK